jgi:hypothetical protein
MLFILFFSPPFLFLGILYFFQEKFIFLKGDGIAKDYSYQFSDAFEEVFINTASTNVINALHFKRPAPKGVILFCHGNKGNLMKWGSRISYLLRYNYEVLVFDYCKYGKSTGKLNEAQLYSDALAVYGHLKKQFKEEQIVVYGFSLGCTFATRIAAIHSPKELVLEAPFFNFQKAVQYVAKYVPTFLLKYAFRTDQDITKVGAPITIFHGTKDQTTSCRQSKRLIAKSALFTNQHIAIEGATHHNVRAFAEYKEKLKEILER